MTKDEELAMDLALEALEYIHEGANNQGPHTGISWRCVAVKAEPAIKAIKQARALDKMAENARELGLDYEPAEVLGHNGWGFPIKAAAPVQEDWGPGPHECHSLTAASVQEPVAWRYRGILHDFDPSDWAEGPVTPLYTTPPAAQRQWVGLTDDEIGDALSVWELTEEWPTFAYAARAIEAKLKEKNT